MIHADQSNLDPLKGVTLNPAPKPRIAEVVTLFKDAILQLCRDTGANGMRFYYNDTLLGQLQEPAISPRTQTASCTKSVAALAIFKLQELGLLDIDQPLASLFTDSTRFSQGQSRTITTRHLLTHTSGLPGNSYFLPKDGSRRIVGDDQFLNHLAPWYDRNTRSSMHELHYKVGEVFDYSNPGSQILEGVVARALRRGGDSRTVSSFMQQELFSPLGMNDTSLTLEEGVVMFNGGLISTAEDLATLGKLILEKGEANGRRIFKAESIAEMLSTPGTIPGAKSTYGHLWWKLPDLNGYMAAGDLANVVVIIPDHKIIISRTHPVPNPPSGASLEKAFAQEKQFYEGFNRAAAGFIAAIALFKSP